MAERNTAKKTKAGSSGIGCLTLLALLLLVIGLVLFNRETILKTFKGSPFIEKFLKDEDPRTSKNEKPPAEQPVKQQPAKNTPAAPQTQPAPKEPSPATATKPVAEKSAEKPVSKPAPEKPAAEKTAAPPAQAPKEEPSKAPAAKTPAVKAPETKLPVEKPKTAATRERTLWFVQVESDGDLAKVKTKRSFPITDNPLVDVLTALMAGPSGAEKKKGYSSLIPEASKLLSATVRGSTVYLSFNEAFQFNSFGGEGIAAQLRQIVWTATEFESVKDVQILIEGRKVDYLGSEGIFIGRPLNRESF